MLTTIDIVWVCCCCHLIRISFGVPGLSRQEAFIDPRWPLRRRTKKQFRRHWPVGDNLKAVDFVQVNASLVDLRWCDSCLAVRINQATTPSHRQQRQGDHFHAGA